MTWLDLDDYPRVECPRCRVQAIDFDGFGFLMCAACRYCTHPSQSLIDGRWRCGLCDDDVGTVAAVEGSTCAECSAVEGRAMNTGESNQGNEDTNEQQQGREGQSFVNHEGQQIDLGTLRGRMDQDLVRRIEAENKGSRDNQSFFEAYKRAHQQKHGAPFSIER